MTNEFLEYRDNQEKKMKEDVKKSKRQYMKKCRWCGNKFKPSESEHKHLCSDKCFHEEKATQ